MRWLVGGACWNELQLDGQFFKELSCVLADDGVFVAQLGESPVATDMGSNHLAFKLDLLAKISGSMTKISDATFVYDHFVPCYDGEWTYAVTCRAYILAQWHTHTHTPVPRVSLPLYLTCLCE